MAIAWESASTDVTADDSDTSLDPAKPSGLAVGDLLLALAGLVSGRTISTPSGWTLQNNVDVAARNTYVFSKIADSGDAAASSFTFALSGGFAQGAVQLHRISGAVDTGMVFSYVTGPNDQTQQCADVTTAADGSLALWCINTPGNIGASSVSRGTERVEAFTAQASSYGASEVIATAGAQTGATITTTSFGTKRLVSIAISPSGGGGLTAAQQAGIFDNQRSGSVIGRMDA